MKRNGKGNNKKQRKIRELNKVQSLDRIEMKKKEGGALGSPIDTILKR